MIERMLEGEIDTHCPKCGKEHDATFFSLLVEERNYVIGDCTACGYQMEFQRDDLGVGVLQQHHETSHIKNLFKKDMQPKR